MQARELATFLESGVAMLGATADARGAPEAFRVWGATVDDDFRVRANVSSHAVRTFESVHDGAAISLVFTDITTFRSVQAKGHVVGAAEPPGPADAALIERYEAAFGAALQQIGHPLTLRESMRPRSVFVVTVAVDDTYDQTPGPTAGLPLEQVNRG